jgi:His/Glu/Gln/Arg/opine family amino acid ABC transporter permease subunit
MTFDFMLIFDSMPRILTGIGMTFQLLFLSVFFALILAVILLLMRISGKWYLVIPNMIYVYIFRGTPILVQIFIIYHGFPQFDFIRNSIFWPIFREPFGCAVVALALNDSAYVSEILRGGVLGVKKELLEAAAALGMKPYQRFIHITSPIAIRLSIPAYSNDFISMCKATALASTITLLDMMGAARAIVSETFAPYEIFISVAIIYLVLTWVYQKSFGLLEKRMSRYVKL